MRKDWLQKISNFAWIHINIEFSYLHGNSRLAGSQPTLTTLILYNAINFRTNWKLEVLACQHLKNNRPLSSTATPIGTLSTRSVNVPIPQFSGIVFSCSSLLLLLLDLCSKSFFCPMVRLLDSKFCFPLPPFFSVSFLHNCLHRILIQLSYAHMRNSLTGINVYVKKDRCHFRGNLLSCLSTFLLKLSKAFINLHIQYIFRVSKPRSKICTILSEEILWILNVTLSS